MGKKSTHKKIKNTGIIFELLVRSVTSDIISGTESKSPEIIKQFFNKNTELYKELCLYQELIKTKFDSENKAEMLINEVLKERSKIDRAKLNDEKYKLVKTLNEIFGLNNFFGFRVSNYKVFAAIYKLFENKFSQPADLVTSRFTLIEYIVDKDIHKETLISNIKEEYEKIDKDLRLLSYKYLVEKFNNKYNILSKEQKELLRQFVNNISNSPQLKEYIESKAPLIKKEIVELSSKVDDDIMRIKLEEVSNNLDNFLGGAIATDEHVLTLLRYYSLVNELKNTLN